MLVGFPRSILLKLPACSTSLNTFVHYIHTCKKTMTPIRT